MSVYDIVPPIGVTSTILSAQEAWPGIEPAHSWIVDIQGHFTTCSTHVVHARDGNNKELEPLEKDMCTPEQQQGKADRHVQGETNRNPSTQKPDPLSTVGQRQI